ATARQPIKSWRGLARFQRTDRLPVAPGAQYRENEIPGNSRGESDGSSRVRSALRLRIQLAEGPLAGGGDLTEGKLLAILERDLSPAFVKHCQCRNAAIACAASANANDLSENTTDQTRIGQHQTRVGKHKTRIGETPKTKDQTPNKHQTPNTKHQKSLKIPNTNRGGSTNRPGRKHRNIG